MSWAERAGVPDPEQRYRSADGATNTAWNVNTAMDGLAPERLHGTERQSNSGKHALDRIHVDSAGRRPAITLDGGTLQATGYLGLTAPFRYGQGGGTIDADGNTVQIDGQISGAGGIHVHRRQRRQRFPALDQRLQQLHRPDGHRGHGGDLQTRRPGRQRSDRQRFARFGGQQCHGRRSLGQRHRANDWRRHHAHCRQRRGDERFSGTLQGGSNSSQLVLWITGSHAVAIDGTNGFSGPITIDTGSTLVVGDAGLTAPSVTDNGLLAFNASGSQTYSGDIEQDRQREHDRTRHADA